MLHNKHVQVDGTDYKLSIEKQGRYNSYKAYLSAVESSYTNEFTFYTISSLEANLEYWIVQQHLGNNPENILFKRLEQWNGVVNI